VGVPPQSGVRHTLLGRRILSAPDGDPYLAAAARAAEGFGYRPHIRPGGVLFPRAGYRILGQVRAAVRAVKVQRDVAVPELDPPATPKKDCLILLALSANSASRDRSKGSGPDSIVSIHLPGSRISFPLMPSMVDWYAGDPTLKYSRWRRAGTRTGLVAKNSIF